MYSCQNIFFSYILKSQPNENPIFCTQNRQSHTQTHIHEPSWQHTHTHHTHTHTLNPHHTPSCFTQTGKLHTHPLPKPFSLFGFSTSCCLCCVLLTHTH